MKRSLLCMVKTNFHDHMLYRMRLQELGALARAAGYEPIGEVLQVMIPAGTQSGTALRLNGKGMPRVGGKGKGDLFVVVEVRTPTDLTDRERSLLQELAALQQTRAPHQTP